MTLLVYTDQSAGAYALCGLQSQPYTVSGCWYFMINLPSIFRIILQQQKVFYRTIFWHSWT